MFSDIANGMQKKNDIIRTINNKSEKSCITWIDVIQFSTIINTSTDVDIKTRI